MRVQEFLADLRSHQKRWTTERDPDLAADIVLIGLNKTTKSHVRKELQAEGFVVDVAIFEPGKTLPESLRTPGGALVVGLKKDAGLIQLVRQQSTFLGDPVADGYFDRNVIQSGLDALETLCARRNWPIVDVSRRSFRETATEVIELYKQRERSKKKEASSA
ncbi:MAG: kinase/pyrophosphorylase [Rhodoplanes sp.]